MAKNVFFSFHYDNDVWRAQVVRKSWVTKPNRAAWGVIDKADFESLQKNGEEAVKRWIDSQLEGTTVTVVLIGSETLSRPFVKYEIKKSIDRKNKIIGVFVNKIEDQNQNTSSRGDVTGFNYPLYDWKDDKGYDNLGDWVDQS
ncbi:MAG TPA: TIR domain-containing protein [Flavitalea sp.]|nr:TIR domain-containing protein [Flavitalea sp.]